MNTDPKHCAPLLRKLFFSFYKKIALIVPVAGLVPHASCGTRIRTHDHVLLSSRRSPWPCSAFLSEEPATPVSYRYRVSVFLMVCFSSVQLAVTWLADRQRTLWFCQSWPRGLAHTGTGQPSDRDGNQVVGMATKWLGWQPSGWDGNQVVGMATKW